MKFFVALAVLALVAVSLAQPVAEAEETLSAVPNAEVNKEPAAAAPAAVASSEGKDLNTASSYGYGYYPYGGYYGGYGGYGGYGLGYGGYGAYGGGLYYPYGGYGYYY